MLTGKQSSVISVTLKDPVPWFQGFINLVSKIYELFFKDIGMCCQRYMSFFPKIYELYTKDGLTIFNSILFFLRQSIKEIGFSRVYNGGSWHNLR